AEHQINYAHILSLRQTVSALEDQLRSTLSQIASTREELLSLPTSAPTTAPARDIPFDELLSYARRIARFTLPPDYRPPPPAKAVVTAEAEAGTEANADTKQPGIAAATEQTNGTTSTPDPSNPPTSAVVPAEAPLHQPPPSPPAPPLETDHHGVALQNLDPDRRAWLQSVSTSPFAPWPNEDIIRSGALADIQAMLERGTDPASILTEEQMAAEAEKRREEEWERQREEEERERRRAEAVARARREAAAEREGGEGMGQPQQEEFGGLDLYDPDEEE
ncbi:hypothetical protein LTS18_002410, partial [Coniosporium uncinatum]